MPSIRASATDPSSLPPLVFDGLNTSRLDTAQIARFRLGGVDAFNWTVVRPQDDWDAAQRGIEAAREAVAAHPDQVQGVLSAADLLAARAAGKIGVVFGLQNARPIADDLDRVATLYHLGVRIVQLTYNERNFVGDGCVEPTDGGLSRLGRRLVAALNEVGILIDLSHCSPQTTLDAARLSRRPVAITHANVRALCDTPRNKSDAEIKAVADSGGCIGAVVWAPLSGGAQRPTLDDLVAHIAYVARLSGEEVISFGSDYSEGIHADAAAWVRNLATSESLYPEVTGHVGDWYIYEQRYVAGLESIAYLPRLSEAMAAHGFSRRAIQGFLGQNLFRVFQAACG